MLIIIMYFHMFLGLEKYWKLVANLMMKGCVIMLSLNPVFNMLSS